jgi:carbonic anhydrase
MLPQASSQAKPAQAKETDGPCPAVEPEVVDANSALKKLEAGNVRWQRSMMEPRNWPKERDQTARCGQKPFAVVVACMDSRVPPELVFDRGLGEIFVIRVAAPVLNDDELASLEFAVVNYKVKLVMVLGHTDCGAVKGAVDRAGGDYLPELLCKIEPAITYVSNKYNGGVRIDSKNKKDMDRVSIANARLVASKIPAFGQSGVKVKWGLYYLANGSVAFDPADVGP